MSLFGIDVKINGVPCAQVMRGQVNGRYQAVFERDRASLEEIESIDWKRPRLSGPCALPRGYGFTVEDISYSMATRSYTVTLQVREQYLGDVAGYEAQIRDLEADNAGRQDTIQQLEEQLAEADENAIALYEKLESAMAQDSDMGCEDGEEETV